MVLFQQFCSFLRRPVVAAVAHCERSVLRGLAVIAIATLASVTASADKRAQEITVSFSADQVRAAGITPGGDAIVFGCLIGRHRGLPSIQRRAEVVHDQDGDGEITLEVPDLPATSVWVVVDFESGNSREAAPELAVRGAAYPREMPIGDEKWKAGIPALEFRRDYLEWLVVRPGVAAWTMSSAEGGVHDSDKNLNGKLKLNLDEMQKLSGAEDKKPGLVKMKDVIVVIDPHTLEYYVRGAK